MLTEDSYPILFRVFRTNFLTPTPIFGLQIIATVPEESKKKAWIDACFAQLILAAYNRSSLLEGLTLVDMFEVVKPEVEVKDLSRELHHEPLHGNPRGAGRMEAPHKAPRRRGLSQRQDDGSLLGHAADCWSSHASRFT